MWYFMLKSGVHATIAGVLMALAVPLRHQLSPQELQQELRPLTGQGGGFEQVEMVIQHLEDVLAKAHSPLHEIEHSLAPYVAFVIMPVFAFFNAGVALGGGEAGLLGPVSIGAFSVFDRQAGRRRGLRLARGQDRPDAAAAGRQLAGMIGVGLLAGIGFTMSLFIANLAFGPAPSSTRPRSACSRPRWSRRWPARLPVAGPAAGRQGGRAPARRPRGRPERAALVGDGRTGGGGQRGGGRLG